MLKKLTIALVAALPLCMAAQVRIATVNVQEIFNAMPDKVQAEAQIKALSSQYEQEYSSVQDEFNKKYAAFQALPGTTPATIRERRMQEIQENDKKIQSFLEQAKNDLNNRERELNAPIKAKINAAIKAVGTEGGYTYIIDSSTVSIVYTGAGAIDVTAQVKAKLGIE